MPTHKLDDPKRGITAKQSFEFKKEEGDTTVTLGKFGKRRFALMFNSKIFFDKDSFSEMVTQFKKYRGMYYPEDKAWIFYTDFSQRVNKLIAKYFGTLQGNVDLPIYEYDLKLAQMIGHNVSNDEIEKHKAKKKIKKTVQQKLDLK